MSRVTRRKTRGKRYGFFILSLALALCLGGLSGYIELAGGEIEQQSALSVADSPGAYEAASSNNRGVTETEVSFVTQSRSRKEIVEAYGRYTSIYIPNFSIYKDAPSLNSPYAPGKLIENVMQSGINRVNLYRFLAGLPELTHTSALDEKAQIGALLLALSDYSHTPSQPEGFPDDLYAIGYSTTDTSNIDSKRLSTPYPLDESVDRMMSDNGDINAMDVGHRRWFLYPQLASIGLGGVLSADDWMMTVFKVSDFDGEARLSMRNDTSTPTAVPWPPAGYCPTVLVSKDDPWSVSISPSDYDRSKTDGITVKLTNTGTGESFIFTEKSTVPAPTFFTVNTQGIGTPFCIVFRSEIAGYADGDTYEVEVSGLVPLSNMPSSFKYTVTFIDI